MPLFEINEEPCADFAPKLFLYAFTVSTDYNDYMNVKEDILLKIAALVRKHGGELAVPARTLHLPEGLRLEGPVNRSEEHTSELQSLMRLSYAVFCLKKNNNNNDIIHT